MNWKIAQAKQHLSEVLKRASREPQVIMNRERPVAAVVGLEDFRDFLQWKEQRAKRPVSEALAELRRICEEDDFVLETPPRVDRDNPMLNDAPRAC